MIILDLYHKLHGAVFQNEGFVIFGEVIVGGIGVRVIATRWPINNRHFVMFFVAERKLNKRLSFVVF